MKRSPVPRLGVCAAAGLALLSASCVSTFKDQAPAPGGGRLVVGHQAAFLGPKARIWLERQGRFEEIRVVEGN